MEKNTLSRSSHSKHLLATAITCTLLFIIIIVLGLALYLLIPADNDAELNQETINFVLGTLLGFVFTLVTTFLVRALDRLSSINAQHKASKTCLEICLICTEVKDYARLEGVFYEYYERLPKAYLNSVEKDKILNILLEINKLKTGRNGSPNTLKTLIEELR